MSTITDVARLAGVSKTTVSRFLNQNGYVSAQAKKQIEHAISELHYKPNPIASGMISRKTKTLGLVVPDITNIFFTQLARAVEDEAQRSGYTTILCNSDNDLKKLDHYISILEERYADGIIICGKITQDAVTSLHKKKMAFVVVDYLSDGATSIYLDNRYGGLIATNHLFDGGYKRIAHIHGPRDSFSANERFMGYQQSLEEHGAALDFTLVQWGDYQVDSGYQAMKCLLALSAIPDAIFVANDMMVFGVLEAIAEAKLTVPQDIGVVGFDDIPILKTAKPAITTVRQPIYEMGVCAVHSLFDLLHGKISPKTILLKPELIIKESSIRK